jgi:hypothetical protein
MWRFSKRNKESWVMQCQKCRSERINMKNQQDEAVECLDHYFTADDVRELAHFGHSIPMGRGFTCDFMNDRYPGWQWGQLMNVLRRADLYVKNEGHGGRIAEGYVGALILAEGDGVAIPDDGSLKHPLKKARLKAVKERNEK